MAELLSSKQLEEGIKSDSSLHETAVNLEPVHISKRENGEAESIILSENPAERKKNENTQKGTNLSRSFVNSAYVEENQDDCIEKTQKTTSTSIPGQPERFESSENDVTERIRSWKSRHGKAIRWTLGSVAFILYNIYFGFAVNTSWENTENWCHGVKFLTIITAIVYVVLLYYLVLKALIVRRLCKILGRLLRPLRKWTNNKYVEWGTGVGILVIMFIFVAIDSTHDRMRLVSGGGLVALLFLGFVGSTHRKQIAWSQVIWGVSLQFLLGLFVLRWRPGREIFQCIGEKVEAFLAFTDYGSSFVFDYLVTGNIVGTSVARQTAIFAFKVIPVILFFSFCVSILYYYGVMQILVLKTGWFLQKTVGTTACESVSASANIFLGMTEAPLMIRPYLPIMTNSELHAVMTGGFATVAGSTLAAYITFGVNASHLLSASVMSAPAALAFSKLMYPETEPSRTTAKDIKIEKAKEKNAIHAGANGVSEAIKLCSNIICNLIAFLAFIHFLDTMLSWFGSLVGYHQFSFVWLLSKIFTPLAFLMGVTWEESGLVGQLLGLKTIVNEFVAYQKLGIMKATRDLSPRSEYIATYALCGFSNLGSIGIQIGGIGAIVPARKADVSRLAVRAMIAGSAACFMTACIAGMLIDMSERTADYDSFLQITTTSNTTILSTDTVPTSYI